MNPARPARRPFALLLLVLMLAGSLRLYLAWKAHVPTLDTAVVGQMALDILAGNRPAFFAGQNYMGALEAYGVAAVFKLIGPGRVTMTFVTIGFALAWITATYFFFRRRHGGWAALAAALVPAFPGWPTAWYTTAPYGGYPETYFFGTILLLLALPFLDQRGFKPSWFHASALAGVAGVAMWTNLQVLPYLAAAGLAGLWAWRRQPRPLRIWVPYGVVPGVVALAFLPQRLAEASHVQAPLFGALSLAAVKHSWRAFLHRDLQQSVLWNYGPERLHLLAAILIATVVVGGVILAFRRRREEPDQMATTWLVLATVAVFALTYFPHPMSGFVPRYLNAPVTLVLSWSLALWVDVRRAWLRRAGFAAALFLAMYHASGILRAAQAKAPDTQQTLADFNAVIRAARDGGWNAILHTGSETEGYDGARLTFLAAGRPVFASAFSERFLDHQLAWEFSARAGFLTRRRHLPFVEGSFAAMNIPMDQVWTTARYALLDTPEVARQLEHSRVPDSLADWTNAVSRHPLFDRCADTTWPAASPSEPWTLTLQFEEPIRLAGLRVSAPSPEELPYRYTVRVRQADGAWTTVQESEHRIAGSYVSGTRLYFRGHHPWMDIRFDPVVGTALEWTLLPGPDNPIPPRLDDLHVLESAGEPWPEWSVIISQLEPVLEATPGACLIAERGVLRALHRYVDSGALAPRLPLPYNPRFARTQPERMPLAEGRYVLVIEDAYGDAAQAVLARCGGIVLNKALVPPFRVLTVAVDAAASGKLAWQGFRPVQVETPSP